MGSLLKQAVRGFANAGVNLADSALAELRQRRLMEAQQAFSRENREIDRADRKEERRQEVDLRNQERQQDMQYRQARDQKEDAYRQQTLDKSDRQFNESLKFSRESEEFKRVSAAYAGALAGVSNASARISEIKSMKPRVSRDGEPIDDPVKFEDDRIKMLAEAEQDYEQEREMARQRVAALDEQHSWFRAYSPHIPRGEAPQPPAMRTPGLLKQTAEQMGARQTEKQLDSLSQQSASGFLSTR